MEIPSHSITDFADNSFQYNSDPFVSYITSFAKCVEENTIDTLKIDQLNQSFRQSGMLSIIKSMPNSELLNFINIVAYSISKSCPAEELPIIISILKLLSRTLISINVQ